MPATGGTGLRILVIEDDPDVRESLRDVLSDSGYDVSCAEEGRSGLAALAAQPRAPAAILLDLTMPGMDGYQFMAELRRHPRWAAIPVLVLTAQASSTKPNVRGAALVVRKPIDLDELLTLVAQVTGSQV